MKFYTMKHLLINIFAFFHPKLWWLCVPHLSFKAYVLQIKTSVAYIVNKKVHYVTLWSHVTVNSLAPGKFEWNFRSLIFQTISVIDG